MYVHVLTGCTDIMHECGLCCDTVRVLHVGSGYTSWCHSIHRLPLDNNLKALDEGVKQQFTFLYTCLGYLGKVMWVSANV